MVSKQEDFRAISGEDGSRRPGSHRSNFKCQKCRSDRKRCLYDGQNRGPSDLAVGLACDRCISSANPSDKSSCQPTLYRRTITQRSKKRDRGTSAERKRQKIGESSTTPNACPSAPSSPENYPADPQPWRYLEKNSLIIEALPGCLKDDQMAQGSQNFNVSDYISIPPPTSAHSPAEQRESKISELRFDNDLHMLDPDMIPEVLEVPCPWNSSVPSELEASGSLCPPIVLCFERSRESSVAIDSNEGDPTKQPAPSDSQLHQRKPVLPASVGVQGSDKEKHNWEAKCRCVGASAKHRVPASAVNSKHCGDDIGRPENFKKEKLAPDLSNSVLQHRCNREKTAKGTAEPEAINTEARKTGERARTEEFKEIYVRLQKHKALIEDCERVLCESQEKRGLTTSALAFYDLMLGWSKKETQAYVERLYEIGLEAFEAEEIVSARSYLKDAREFLRGSDENTDLHISISEQLSKIEQCLGAVNEAKNFAAEAANLGTRQQETTEKIAYYKSLYKKTWMAYSSWVSSVWKELPSSIKDSCGIMTSLPLTSPFPASHRLILDKTLVRRENLNPLDIADLSQVEINEVNMNGETALVIAVRNQDLWAISKLLAMGAHTNGSVGGLQSPLGAAIEAGNIDIIKILLKHDDKTGLCRHLGAKIPCGLSMEVDSASVQETVPGNFSALSASYPEEFSLDCLMGNLC